MIMHKARRKYCQHYEITVNSMESDSITQRCFSTGSALHGCIRFIVSKKMRRDAIQKVSLMYDSRHVCRNKKV
jgi:hypothetical protein